MTRRRVKTEKGGSERRPERDNSERLGAPSRVESTLRGESVSQSARVRSRRGNSRRGGPPSGGAAPFLMLRPPSLRRRRSFSHATPLPPSDVAARRSLPHVTTPPPSGAAAPFHRSLPHVAPLPPSGSAALPSRRRRSPHQAAPLPPSLTLLPSYLTPLLDAAPPSHE